MIRRELLILCAPLLLAAAVLASALQETSCGAPVRCEKADDCAPTGYCCKPFCCASAALQTDAGHDGGEGGAP